MYNTEVINEIKTILIRNEETIAVAESVTAGHLQAALSLAIDASKFFQGGLTVYNTGQKTRQLNVDPIHADNVNAVSERVSIELAVNVSAKFLSTYGIGITGYATIVPQCETEGLHAFFCVSKNGKPVLAQKIVSYKTDPLQTQLDYALQVLEAFFGYLKAHSHP